ncbi:MAG TPA: RluA family pseudouridine synthase [Kofleriaceae bacterium]
MIFVAPMAGKLVDVVKAHLVVVPVGECGALIASGAVSVNGITGRINDAVVVGDELAAQVTGDVPEEVELSIVEDTSAYVIVDKPAGMHVHPIGAFRTGTLVNAMLHLAGARMDRPWAAWRPHPAHRLDRAASGLVAIAKGAAAHDRIRRAFDAGLVDRRYYARVHGLVGDDAGTIDAPLGRDPMNDYRRAVVPDGQRAITHYRVVSRDATTTLVELTLETGRTHQIRAHLASVGHPIVGDTLYLAGTDSSAAIELRAISLAFR